MKAKNTFLYAFQFIIVIVMLQSVSYGQVISYAYDASGNRVERNIYYPSRKGNNESAQDSTQIPRYYDSFKNATVKIYPNPTEGVINIEVVNYSPENSFSLRVFDLNGKNIYNKDEMSTAEKIDISHLDKGSYILRIILGNETREWKIIKI